MKPLTMYILSRVAAGLALSLIAIAIPAHAQTPSLSDLVNALTTPMDEFAEEGQTRGGPKRVFRDAQQAAGFTPDGQSARCPDGSISGAGLSGGSRGTRDLYVVTAPSVDLSVQFEEASYKLTAADNKLLIVLGQALAHPLLVSSKFLVVGHTDKRGDDLLNRRLSCARSLAVKEYLIKAHGIAPERLVAFGFGFNKLKNSTDPMAGENRRVEVRKFED